MAGNPQNWSVEVWHRSPWKTMHSVPSTSGIYEVRLRDRTVVQLSWNGRLWLEASGAAASPTALRAALWRGLVRSAYERACDRLGVSVLIDHASDRRVQADRRSRAEMEGTASGDTVDTSEAAHPAFGEGLSRVRKDRCADDMGLFGPLDLTHPCTDTHPPAATPRTESIDREASQDHD